MQDKSHKVKKDEMKKVPVKKAFSDQDFRSLLYVYFKFKTFFLTDTKLQKSALHAAISFLRIFLKSDIFKIY